MNHIVFIKGKDFFLRPLMPSDIDGNYASWLNDAEINKYTNRHRTPITHQVALDYINDSQSEDRLVLAICTDSYRHIGNISIQGIDWINRSAELAILIGEKDYHKKGIGTEACRLMIDHAFNRLNLHRLWLGTPALNLGMINIAKKVGMSAEGILKDAFFCNGKYCSVLRYSIIKSEYAINYVETDTPPIWDGI